jgi:glycosyltransferase involved in cell wall biosynthesis
MKIAIDCRKIRDGGIGTYLVNLLIQWQRQNLPAKLYLFGNSDDKELLFTGDDFAEFIAHDIPKYSIGELFSFSKPLRKIGVDLFFAPHYTLPFNLPCRSVVTIHDLIHFRYPGKAGLIGKAYARYMVGHACRQADAILTISEYSARDIAEHYKGCAPKIRHIYPGVDREIFKSYPRSEVEYFRDEISLPGEFILYVGALKPHKNPRALVEIANRLNIPVVIATQDRREAQEKLLGMIKNRRNMKFINISDNRQMALVYNAARLLIHPSFYEGFGLPPLEAMACGLPVVCSDNASLPEVVGDAALTFAPKDYEEMLEKINLCWRDEGLRNILENKGRERAGLFDWDRAARNIFEIFREVIDS